MNPGADENRPQLYKYRFIDEDHLTRTSRTFTHNELYFPHARQFNDPFDSQFSFSFAATKERLRKYLRKNVRRNLSNMNRQQREAWIAEKIRQRSFDNSAFEAELVSKVEETIKGIGLYSLTRVPDDVLMWSHYSKSHEGFCLVFDERQRFIAQSQEIVYLDEYPIVNPILDSYDVRLKKTLFTKATRWNYEKEFRLFDYQAGPGTKTFPPEALVGVIFGCRMSEPDKARIKEWCKNRKTEIDFFQALKASRTYSLEITPL